MDDGQQRLPVALMNPLQNQAFIPGGAFPLNRLIKGIETFRSMVEIMLDCFKTEERQACLNRGSRDVGVDQAGAYACRRAQRARSRKKKPVRRRAKEPPPLPCRTRSFEHVLLHVELVCPLSASSKGVPATDKTYSVIVFITVQGLLRITNKAGKIQLQSKNSC